MMHVMYAFRQCTHILCSSNYLPIFWCISKTLALRLRLCVQVLSRGVSQDVFPCARILASTLLQSTSLFRAEGSH